MHTDLNTLTSFLFMGGYWPFVWPAYAIMVTLFVVGIVSPVRRFHRITTKLRVVLRNTSSSGCARSSNSAPPSSRANVHGLQQLGTAVVPRQHAPGTESLQDSAYVDASAQEPTE